MSRFLAGFGTATAVWAVVVSALVVAGVLSTHHDEGHAIIVVHEDTDDAGVALARGPRRGRRGRGGGGGAGGGGSGGSVGTGGSGGSSDSPEDILTGDDLGDDVRTVNAGDNGGEEQLTPQQIEQTFDGVFPRIRRCLVLVDGDVRGRLTFRFRVAHDGHVVAINLQGPSNVTGGEPGDCLRTAARGAHFPSFHGPDTFASYPLTLE